VSDDKHFEPWNHQLSIWSSKAKYFQWLRGWLRRIWADNPLRSEWKAKQLRPVSKAEKVAKLYHPSTKNVGQCYICKGWFAGSKLECDHIIESDGCYDFETATKFLWHCAANDPENWALVCKPCHKAKSYSVAQGLSMEDAIVTKKAINIENTQDVKVFLKSKGITPESNAKKRREQLVQYFKSIQGGQ
jgi:hypothetical protein